MGDPVISIASGDSVLGGDVTDAMISGDKLFVLQGAEARVAAFSVVDGRLLWRFGRRGAGPSEFAVPSTMFALTGGGVGVVDPRQGRITLLNSDGGLRHTIGGDALAHEVHNACDAGAAGIVAIHLPAFALVRFDSSGDISATAMLRWPDPRMNDVIQFKQGFFARSRAERCIIFSMRGDYFVELNAQTFGLKTFHRYVKPFVFARVEQKNGMPILVAGTGSAGYPSAAVSSDNLYVLGGEGSLVDRVIDVYAVDDGAYRGSILLGSPAFGIDVDGDRLMVIADTEDGAKLEVYGLPKLARVE